MTDKLDLLMSDYMTGMLQVKINSRELWITRQKHEERIGSSGTSSNTAPQERRMMILEEDTKLQKMKDQQRILTELLGTVSPEIRMIITLRFKEKKQWWQIGARLYMDERTARRKYENLKELLRDSLWRDLV
jgi:RinA family phage transcriptional activator